MQDEFHECDLFLMTSHRGYYANSALAEFARRGQRNINGWGIGSFKDGKANVIRSSDAALSPSIAGEDLSREFNVAIQTVSTDVILGHLRLASRGATNKLNNHPFQLPFLGYDWLLIHNGTARKNLQLVPNDQWLITDSNSDTPRVFEYLRRKAIDYFESSPKKSLIEALRSAYTSLLSEDSDGSFNLILSNGYLSVAFIQRRPFHLLRREKDQGDAVLLSTLRLSKEEDWVEFKPSRRKHAKMLVFSGPTLIFNGDIPR